MPNRLSLINQRYSRLVVLKRLTNNKRGNTVWECLCDCGNTVSALGTSLVSGNTKSCGCYKTEIAIRNGHNKQKNPGFAMMNKLYHSLVYDAVDRNYTVEL